MEETTKLVEEVEQEESRQGKKTLSEDEILMAQELIRL